MWVWDSGQKDDFGLESAETRTFANGSVTGSWASHDSSTEVQRRIEASDLEWLSAQFSSGQLSHTLRLELQPLIVYCAARGYDKLAYEIGLRCASEEIDAVDDEGKTALIWAAQDGRTALVIALLSLGADHEMECVVDRSGPATALTIAKAEQHQETYHFLCHFYRAGTEEKRKALVDEHLDNAIYEMEWRHRVIRDDGEWIEGELSAGRLGAEYMMTKDESLLCYAVKCDKSSLVHPLLKFGADPNDANDYGVSVLYFAADNQDFEAFRLLLLYGASYLSYDQAGYNSPEWACKEQDNTELPAYANAWAKMTEEERIAERAKYAPEFGEKAAAELERLDSMSREDLYALIAKLQAKEKEFNEFKRSLNRKKGRQE